MLSQSAKDRLNKAADLLYTASRQIKILRSVAWPLKVRTAFFQKKAQVLPVVEYEPFDLESVSECISQAQAMLKKTVYDIWLNSKAEDLKLSARLISSRGTKDFFNISNQVYGLPTGKLRDGAATPLDLAVQFQSILDSFQKNPGVYNRKMSVQVDRSI